MSTRRDLIRERANFMDGAGFELKEQLAVYFILFFLLVKGLLLIVSFLGFPKGLRTQT